MIRIKDTLAGERVRFHCVESQRDLLEVRDFIRDHRRLGFDTESTGLNCYRPGWELRTAQWGNKFDSYVVPARWYKFISWAMCQPTKLIGHNLPHDIRCIDHHLGYATGIVGHETYIPAHHVDSRGKEDGGTGHGLKELSIALIDRSAGKWDEQRKEAFKQILIRIPGEFYKANGKGHKKGDPKYRKARLEEGWSLIDPMHPAMIAYAAADPMLTYWLWELEVPFVKQFRSLYNFDRKVAQATDRLQRRGWLADKDYTRRLSRAQLRKAEAMMKRCAGEYRCMNIQSTDQVAATLLDLGADLVELTPSGKYKMDGTILRGLMDDPYSNAKIKDFIHCVLIAKQLLKRRSTYSEAILREMDENGRVHTSLNALGARTSRMSAANPPTQQLPTKDREDEIMWQSEEL